MDIYIYIHRNVEGAAALVENLLEVFVADGTKLDRHHK